MLGKSVFIWQVSACCGGDVKKIAAALRTAGFQSAIIHCETLQAWRTPARIALVNELKATGIACFGGGAVYGSKAANEGAQAGVLVREFALDGFVFDAESDFDAKPHADSNAVVLLQAYRQETSKPAGWCWWAFYQSSTGKTVYHPKSVLWAAMDPKYGNADFGVPMVYWSWGDNSVAAMNYLDESWKQWRAITDKPIEPAGRAYVGNDGTPNPEAIKAFDARARQLGAEGITWWSMQHALDAIHLPGVWQTLVGLPAFGDASQTPDEPQTPVTAGIYMKAVRFVNVRAEARSDSADVGDVQAGQAVGPIVGIAGGRSGAWAHLADGHYVCVADASGITYLVEK
jgi:hypothetical protein